MFPITPASSHLADTSPSFIQNSTKRSMGLHTTFASYTKMFIGAIFFQMLLIVGCGSSTLDPNGQNFQFQFLDGVTPAQIASIDDRENRVLIIDIDGNIYTLDPDGRRRQAITTSASRTLIHQQPTWSPDTNRIAWTQVSSEGNRVKPSLVVGSPDGTVLSNIELPFAPFYIYWSPDSQRLAYLSNWLSQSTQSMALRTVELSEAQPTTTTIAEGQPFYFSWSPDGQELLSHVGNEVVTVYSLDGNQEPLSDASSGFPAPQWTSDGNLVFAIDDQNGQGHLIMSDRLGTELTELTTYVGSISFSLNSTEDMLAYAVSDQGGASAAVGSLYVIDMETYSTRELSVRPVVAFFWSPDGEKLAYLQFEIEDSQTALRWKVWEDGEITTYDRFVPSQLFMRRYLAFFDQYSLSMNIWSPDSTAFVYAGTDGIGRRGVFVQTLEEERPKRISSGFFAAWSPN